MKISYKNFLITSNSISFEILENKVNKFEKLFFDKKDNTLNPFIANYNSFELDFKNKNGNINIFFSKFGILSLNTSALNQSIEIIRRRIDDIGTKEPTILQRGDKRILVELPGIKDPERVKELLGKTAQLNFKPFHQYELTDESFNKPGLEGMSQFLLTQSKKFDKIFFFNQN